MATSPDFSHLPSFVPDEPLDAGRTESVSDASDPVLQVGLWDPAGIAALTTGDFKR
jgi:hypothetical protein